MVKSGDKSSKGIAVPHAGAIPMRIGADGPAVEIGQAVGEKVKALRTERGVTQAELARMLSTLGDRWTKGRVFALEAGTRETVTLTELVQLAIVLEQPIHDFVDTPVELRIGSRAVVGGSMLASFIRSGKVPPWTLDDADLANSAPDSAVLADPAAAEIAERLGLDTSEEARIKAVTETAMRLYGRSVTAERERRVGEVAEPGSTGAASRQRNFTLQIVAELRQEMDG